MMKKQPSKEELSKLLEILLRKRDRLRILNGIVLILLNLVAFIILYLCLTQESKAADLGVWGSVYKIEEKSMLDFIDQRLKEMNASGELARLEETTKERIIKNTLRPKPVEGLIVDNVSHTFYFDPSFTVTKTLTNLKGDVFAKAGDIINPLDIIPFNETLYFIDSDDNRQIEWMKQQKSNTIIEKIILINGDVQKASKELKKRIYFDQNGILTSRLNLKYIPAKVTKDGNKIRIDSIGLKGEK